MNPEEQEHELHDIFQEEDDIVDRFQFLLYVECSACGWKARKAAEETRDFQGFFKVVQAQVVCKERYCKEKEHKCFSQVS